jgi:hypothetical protein
MTRTPWIGLAALIAMFLIPFLPNWLFEGPRTVKHWPRRHMCGYCNAPWTEGHICAVPMDKPSLRLRGDLRRLNSATRVQHTLGSSTRRSNGQSKPIPLDDVPTGSGSDKTLLLPRKHSNLQLDHR